jgi:nicotinate-nucleotide--dimethylbenzimidazole phosphoribosyltransferase
MEKELQKKIDLKTKPPGSLGKLERIALKAGMVQRSLNPELRNPAMLVFAADHGLTEEGVSSFPKEVTHQMVMNFLGGGAAISVFCRQNGINLKVIDAGVDFDFSKDLNLVHQKVAHGTKNMMYEPAMSIELCKEAMLRGRRIVNQEFEHGCNTVGFGEMGIGNTSSAALLMHKISGYSIDECTDRGTGHDDEGLKKKKQILKIVAGKYKTNSPEEILATFGGFEIAMMCGAILEARENNMLILIDGFITTAAFMVAHAIQSNVMDNAVFCHVSKEKGHRLMHEFLRVEPLLDLDMRLGEGSGVAVAFPVIKAAVAFLNEMASFDDAGVSNKES